MSLLWAPTSKGQQWKAQQVCSCECKVYSPGKLEPNNEATNKQLKHYALTCMAGASHAEA